MAEIKTKRDRIKFASDNVTGACPAGHAPVTLSEANFILSLLVLISAITIV